MSDDGQTSEYIKGCLKSWEFRKYWVPFSKKDGHSIINVLKPIINKKVITVVARGDGEPIDQNNPVMYINHCRGYDGGRADFLMLVASINLTKIGINKELEEVAQKAKVVIIRDFGQLAWVKDNLKTSGVVIVMDESKHQVTTGTVACVVACLSGGIVQTVGFQRGIDRIAYCHSCFPIPCLTEEVAMLESSSRDRTKSVY